MKKKMVQFLAVLGLCFLPEMAASWPPPCTLICCPPDDWGAECWAGYPTTCQSWWYFEGGTCP